MLSWCIYNWYSMEWGKKFTNLCINLRYRYIEDVLSLNNSRFGDFVDRIYPIELEIKDTTDTDRLASCLDLHLEIDSEGRLRTKNYDKRDDSNFPIVNLSLLLGFSGVRVPRSLVLYVYFLDRCLSFFVWPLCCVLLQFTYSGIFKHFLLRTRPLRNTKQI